MKIIRWVMREGSDRQQVVPEILLEADVGAGGPGVAIGFGVGVGGGERIVLVDFRPLDEAGGLLVEVDAASVATAFQFSPSTRERSVSFCWSTPDASRQPLSSMTERPAQFSMPPTVKLAVASAR